VKLTDEQISAAISDALKNGNWMIRRSNAGKAYGGFQWNGIGDWTEALDWDGRAVCGGGLHGCGPSSAGYYTSGIDVDFCVTGKEVVDIDGVKIKCKTAMVLARNSLPKDLSVGGSLGLSGTQITSLPKGLSVCWFLYLSGTQITSLPEDLSVGGRIFR